MTHLRRKPKQFSQVQRLIYQAELLDCPACASPLGYCDHYAFTKTIQQLDRVISVASRPKECRNPVCSGYGQRFFAAAAQALALPKSTYGLDVIAQIGWWRDFEFLSGNQIYLRLCERLQISRRQIDLLTAQYRILRGAAEQLDLPNLARSVATTGGLVISLDGLEPEGAQEQLWVVREVQHGTILAVAWLPRTTTETLSTLLAPVVVLLREQNWRLLATVSDRERAVEAALTAVWPDVPHQWCQAHYLRNLRKPLQEQDQAFRVSLRHELREANQAELRQLANDATSGAFSPGAGEWVGRGGGKSSSGAVSERS